MREYHNRADVNLTVSGIMQKELTARGFRRVELWPPAVDSDLPRNTPPADSSGIPKPEAQRNFTDPESRIMKRDGGFLQGYNAQIAVDEGHQIIVAAALSNQAPDVQYFEPMLRRVVDNWHEAGISVHAGYMLGFPFDGPDCGRIAARTLKKIGFDIVSFFIMTPLPGTEYLA